jgi:heterodisulfide reductase subunit C
MPVRETFGLVPPGTVPIFYLVFLPFAAVFIYGVWLRLSGSGLVLAILRGPGGLAGAVRRLLVYVFLQRRVGRRARGWPHLANFSGFITLLLATTIVAIDWDIARPLGFRVLTGARYLYFELFADALGLVFVIGLIGALVWRLAKLRHAGPDQRRVQYQFLALTTALLYLGVTGFVLESLRLIIRPVEWANWSFVGTYLSAMLAGTGIEAVAPTLYIWVWWAHGLVVFALIASLPYTVFLHAGAAPLNLMAQPGKPRLELSTPFDLREVLESGNFDVKSGVATFADLEPEMRFAVQACTNCGRCDSVCPAFATGTALSPRRLVQTLRKVALRGNTSDDVLTLKVLTAEELWACTSCAACVEACPVFIRPVDYIIPFRRELVSRQILQKRQSDFLANLGRSANPYGLAAERRAQLAEELGSEPNSQ